MRLVDIELGIGIGIFKAARSWWSVGSGIS